MPKTHVVVDGSNIATEGRTFPSLKQLESALVELRKEMPKAEITVVVDATFAHRVDPSERKHFEDAQAKGGYITPPAGAIGRGDAFILKIAEKVNAVVLSNDSFQEFHGEHAWLFEPGRLLGASPVPGVGWIFVPRTPVRGPKSRVAVRGVRDLPPMPEPKTPPPRRPKKVIAEVVEVPVKKERAPRIKAERKLTVSPEPVNDPTTFITFIASHPLGEEIEAEVESFTSHGAIIRFENVQCYAPLSGLGSPPPRSPREVLERGEKRTFVIRGLDPQRRGIELALPEVVQKSNALQPGGGTQTGEETATTGAVKRTAAKGTRGEKTAVKSTLVEKVQRTTSPVAKSAAKRAAVSKQAPKRAIAKALAPTKTATKNTVSKSMPPKKAAVTKSTTKKIAAVKVPSVKKAASKKAAPQKTASNKAALHKVATQKVAPQKVAPQKVAPQKVVQRGRVSTTTAAKAVSKNGTKGVSPTKTAAAKKTTRPSATAERGITKSSARRAPR